MAHAADAGGGASVEAEHAQADTLFHQGVSALNANEWERARRLFKASYDLFPRGTALGNWGWSEVKLGYLVDGLHHLRQALNMSDLVDVKRAVVERAAADAYAATGHLSVRVDDGAAIFVDGVAEQATAPASDPIDVMPGPRVVEVRFGGRFSRQQVDVPAGAVVALDMREPAPAPLGVVPQVPPAQGPSSAGPSASGTGDGSADRRGPQHSWWTAPRIAGVALAAGAVAGLGVGLYFHTASVNDAHDSYAQRSTLPRGLCVNEATGSACTNLNSTIDQVHGEDTASKVGWIVAGAMTAGSVVAFAIGATHRSSASAIVVQPTLGFGTVGLTGRF